MKAVEEGKFTIWAVDDVTDALPLLLNLVWDGEGQTTLMQTIQERIAQHRNRKDVTVFHGHYVG
ncbi:protease La [Escherichia coli]|uniref:Protease La n=1 Tax=Escherichia coli TaxID=562 RepID=A0A377ATW9_ECOLX|nr:protease La [Escherichia coli]